MFKVFTTLTRGQKNISADLVSTSTRCDVEMRELSFGFILGKEITKYHVIIENCKHKGLNLFL